MKSIFNWIGIVALSIFLVACGSAPKPKAVSQPVEKQPKTVVKAAKTPSDLIRDAEVTFMQTGSTLQRNLLLLKAADLYAQDSQCKEAKTIISTLLPEMSDKDERTYAFVILAECLIRTSPVDYKILSAYIDNMTPHSEYRGRVNALHARLHLHQTAWLDAANAFDKSDLPDTERAINIWNALLQLSLADLEEASLRARNLRSYLQLAIIVRQYALNPVHLQAAINDWQNRHLQHPLATNPPPVLAKLLETPTVDTSRISILLPLTGRLSQQGQAIKEGIMAAYFQDASSNVNVATLPVLTFVDTNTYDEENSSELIANSSVIIGPLLKENIRRVLPSLTSEVTLLALNRIDTEIPSRSNITFNENNALDTTETHPNVAQPLSTNSQYYFALAPEDEAVQLAKKVKKTGAKFPVVVAHDSATARRMADTFISSWKHFETKDQSTPLVTYFNDNDQLREGITSILDVAQSKARIKQIENLVRKELHSVPRNRRDIDAIIVFADPKQTELLNPIIESSLSPFNRKVVPVFASSRSYSQQLNQNSLRDLKNLTFTDMPWMLPSHRWSDLQQEAQALWPQRNDTLQRLFALGYDAYTISPYLHHLRLTPNQSIQGLTGELKINPQGVIYRTLPYAQINNNEVQRIASD
ncbi:penicillin-binding protein activator [Aestuariibacter sp. AA17]|uniref:Penicillin-binding protein activator n=1 Tax=Fluctibacter corallii TaxID=2984329 RepID=A0ABT3A4R1_9ALTE|nr:penicillin-binding protein activator [Aestuariibacter sp. AA17]MCV2883524.1 penicillin-binding protein activator [Aestuariibacter sp. AA17]